MRLSELFNQLSAVPCEIHEFSLALAEPDIVEGDTVDVQLVPIGRLELLFELGEARVHPVIPDEAADDYYTVLGVFLEKLPLVASPDLDLRLTVELPLIREGASLVDRQVREIEAAHVGVQSEEVWLLVRPVEEYGEGVLPE